MTQDHQLIESQEGGTPSDANPAAKRRSGPGPIVIAGVVGSCVLGAGLGLWARPADPGEAPAAVRPAPVSPPRPAALQIVVADEPAPIGQPLEVLPGDFAEPQEAPPAPAMIAPRRAASGLVKVDAPIAADAPLVTPAVKVEPRDVEPAPKPEPAPKLRKAEAPKAQPPKAQPLKAEVQKLQALNAKAAKAAAEKARLAKAKLAQARAAVEAKAKAKKAAELAAARDAKAEKARAARLAKLEKEKAAKARLAKAEAAAKKKAVATRRLAAAAKQKAAPSKKAKPEVRTAARKKPVQMAEARAKPAKARPVAKAKKTPPVVTAAKAPPKRVVVPRGEGPMRVARAKPCAQPDAGEAAVCADPRLGVRERQLQQAYRNAEAAGVPASALRRHEARWQQARAAVARDAPWAVEDVYVARISELNDLTRDAREN